MLAKKFDVLIIGAGPAGAACAITLGRSGLQVALLDKATFPRDKTCGDALSVDVINQLLMLSSSLASGFNSFTDKLPSYGVKIFSPDYQHINIPFVRDDVKSCGYICERTHFDNLLFQHVKDYNNVHIFEDCDVQKIDQDKQAIHIQTSKGNFEGDLVIGADGAHSVVSRYLSNIKVEKKHYSAGLRVYYEGVTSFHEQNYIELHFFRNILPGYLWIFPLKNNKANVGIGIPSSVVAKKRINLKETLQTLLETHPPLKERFHLAKPLETVKGYGLPLGSKQRNISGERFLLAGDAASLIDPFSGEGIANAIRSGRVAAQHTIRCFEKQDFSSEFNKEYDIEIYRRMWKEFRISKSMQKLASYPALFNFLIRKANKNRYLMNFLIKSLANIDEKKRLLKPGFYYRMLFKDTSDL